MSQPDRPDDQSRPPWPRGSLIAQLAPLARAELLASGTLVEHRAGERIIRQGERSSDVFLIVRGVAKVTAESVNGESGLLAVRVMGDAVGELAGLDGAPRIANVTAADLVRSRRIAGPSFQAILARHPDAALSVSRSVSQKLRWATRRRIDFSNYTVAVRLARLIVDLAARHGGPLERGIDLGVELSQPELAALVGAGEPSVHRALRDLREANIILTGYRRFVVTDMPALITFAELDDEEIPE